MDLGQKMTRFFELKNAIAELNSQKRDLQRELDEVEYMLIQDMDANGIDKTSNEYGTVSKTVELYPSVVDKEAFVQWAIDNGRTDMLPASCNKAPFKQFFEEENMYPDGIDAFDKIKLNYRRRR